MPVTTTRQRGQTISHLLATSHFSEKSKFRRKDNRNRQLFPFHSRFPPHLLSATFPPSSLRLSASRETNYLSALPISPLGPRCSNLKKFCLPLAQPTVSQKRRKNLAKLVKRVHGCRGRPLLLPSPSMFSAAFF